MTSVYTSQQQKAYVCLENIISTQATYDAAWVWDFYLLLCNSGVARGQPLPPERCPEGGTKMMKRIFYNFVY